MNNHLTIKIPLVNNNFIKNNLTCQLVLVNNRFVNNIAGSLELNDVLEFRFVSNRPCYVYYTLDGSNPKTSNTRILFDSESVPLPVDGTYTVKYFGIDDLNIQTEVHEKSYIVDSIPPIIVFNPVSGTFNEMQAISISASEPTTIYYTKDGSTPVSGNPNTYLYTTAIPVSAAGTTVIKAYGIDAGNLTSTVVSGSFTIVYIPPILNLTPSGGTFTTTQNISISANEPANIFYTTNGTTPVSGNPNTYLYTTAIPVSAAGTTIIKAIGIDSDNAISNVVSGNYYIAVLSANLLTPGPNESQGWGWQGGWSLGPNSSNPYAYAVGASLDTSATSTQGFTNGATYQITYTITDYSAGSFLCTISNAAVNGTPRSGNGTYVETIVADGNNFRIFAKANGTIGKVSNILVQQYI